jgi:ferritin heavy chain
LDVQTKRGGRTQLREIAKPLKTEWTSGIDAMQSALELQKQINEALLAVHALATKHNDAHLSDLIEEEFLREKVDTLKTLSDHITNLKRVGPGLGEYMFDKETLSS